MIDIHIPNLAQLRAKLQPSLVREPAAELLASAAAYVVREAQTGMPRDTGAIAHGLAVKVHGLEARVTATLPVMVMEFGRRAGAKMPPQSAIAAWAGRHGLEGLEYPIARAIARRGIKGRFFIRRAREKLLHGELAHLMRVAIAAIERRWAA